MTDLSSRIRRCLTALMLLAAAPAPLAQVASAAEEEVGAIPTAQQGLVTGIATIILFLVVFAILSVFVWPRIAKGLDERANKIREEIAAAEAARAQAKEALEEYERSLASARAESQKMLEQTKAEQQKLAQELRAKADKEIVQLRERAMRDIEAAGKAAVAEIYHEAATLATHMAGKILGREITATDQQRLVDESLRELGLATPSAGDNGHAKGSTPAVGASG